MSDELSHSISRERSAASIPGIPIAIGLLVLQIAAAVAIVLGILGLAFETVSGGAWWLGLGSIGSAVLVLVGWIGLFMVAPNEARVMQLFGDYAGTVRVPGLRWANPFYTKRRVSTRIRNFDSDKLKVNDLVGNPIEIGAVVVWQVVDTAEAVFEVDDFENFVRIQAEAALRGLASRYPYDLGDEDEGVSLRSQTDEIAGQLAGDIQARLEKAGVKVIEARISHLAYASEIASAMLQRQQASAIIAARRRIVDGAVGMVEMALNQLSEKGVVELDDERRAAMVSNLLVVLCSDKSTSPVVNTGSLYS